MGNFLSSTSRKVEARVETEKKKLDAANQKLRDTVEDLKDKRVMSKESVERLEREVASQRKTIELLKKAGKEMMQDDKICANTKRELESVVTENDELVADMKAATERHRAQVEELTNAKVNALNDLEKQRAKSEANDRARAQLEVKLVDAKREVQDCLSREKALKATVAKMDEAVRRLMRNRQDLIRRANQLTATVRKVDDLRQKQAVAFAAEKRELRASRPIAMDRVNNASESISVATESLRISFSNIDVKGVAGAQAVVVVLFRSRDNKMQSATIRFSGNDGLTLYDVSGKKAVASNLRKGADVTKVLANLFDNLPIQVSRTPLLRNGWSFTFPPPPQGGLFTRVTVAVEGSNEWYGLSGLQISERAPVVPKMMIARRFRRTTSAPTAKTKPEARPASMPSRRTLKAAP